MNIRISTYGLLKLLTALLLLPMASACSLVTDDYDNIENQPEARYINLTIAVSNGLDNMTRAADDKPTAGENGDGREAGFLRENAVTGITLILYQDVNGINGDPTTQLDLVKYYRVERMGTSLTVDGSNLGNSKEVEAYYTTGNQKLNEGEVNFSKSYHAIVIANADLRGKVSTLGEVRNYKFNTLYNGNETSSASDCTNFIMSSEADYTMNFQTTTPTTFNDGLLYTFENVLIERLAARIDFWAACSNGYKTSTDNAAYNIPGYEYDVEGTSDKFVVTGIMPFNLNGADNTNGGEFLIKRLANEVSESPTITYLADETGSNYVIDPATWNKTSSGYLTYFKNRLSKMLEMYDVDNLANISSFSANTYYKSVASLHSAVTATGSDAGYLNLTDGLLSGENVIITYPMENTLWSASRLYNYATGIVIEGDYYTGGSGTPEHRIYYGYMRHEGTSSSAYSAVQGADMSSIESVTSANCMEFAIVRNNIYRVYISGINATDGKIKIKIEEKHWRHVDNPTIYI